MMEILTKIVCKGSNREEAVPHYRGREKWDKNMVFLGIFGVL